MIQQRQLLKVLSMKPAFMMKQLLYMNTLIGFCMQSRVWRAHIAFKPVLCHFLSQVVRVAWSVLALCSPLLAPATGRGGALAQGVVVARGRGVGDRGVGDPTRPVSPGTMLMAKWLRLQRTRPQFEAACLPSRLRRRPPLNGCRVGEALNPGPLATFRPEEVADVPLTFLDGRAAVLRASWIAARSVWRWQTSTRPRLVSSDRRLAEASLQTWRDRHGASLSAASLTAVQASIDHLRERAAEEQALVTAAAMEVDPPTPAPDILLPSLAECENILALEPELLQAAGVRSQRTVPKSLVAEVLASVRRLYAVMNDNAHPQALRTVAEALTLLWPRLLLPEPLRVGKQLVPHSRPRVVKERLEWLRAGKWHQVWQAASPPPLPPLNHEPASEPGHLTALQARKLAHAASAQLTGRMWRQLWSAGLAPPLPATTRALEQYWGHTQEPLAQAEGGCTPQEALDLTRDEEWQKAVAKLRPGTSPDANGWWPDTFRWASSRPELAPLMRQQFQAWLQGDMRDLIRQLLNTSQITALRKPNGGIRPVAASTQHRKVLCTLILNAVTDDIRQAVGPHQFGIMKANGAVQLAQTVAEAAAMKPTEAVIGLDVTAAFSTIHRTVLARGVQEVAPELWRKVAHLVLTPHHGVIRDGPRRRRLTTHMGMPQGDCLSALCFALGQAFLQRRAAHRLKNELALEIPIWSYIDDQFLQAPVACADRAVQIIQEELLRGGLALNMLKCQVWIPAQEPLPPGLLKECHAQQLHADGIVVAGCSNWWEELPGDNNGVPVGESSFLDRAMERITDDLIRRRQVLSQLPALLGPSGNGLQVAWHINRTSVQQRLTHLLRALPPTKLRPWLDRVDASQLGFFAMQFGEEPSWTTVRQLRQPRRHGGLGLTSAQDDAPLLFLAAALEPAQLQRVRRLWEPELRQAVETVAAQAALSPQEMFGMPTDALLEQGGVRLLPMMREKTAKRLQPTSSHAAADVLGASHHLSLPVLMHPPTPAVRVSDGAWRSALRRWGRLPLIAAEARCAYVPRAAAGPCGHAIDPQGAHCQRCARGLLMARHNRVVKCLQHLATQAGCAAHLEQLIPIRGLPPPDGERAAGLPMKRADLLVRSPEGQVIALDVRVSHADSLETSESIKFREYGVAADTPVLPDARRFVPAAIDAQGRCGPTLAPLMRQWAGAAAARSSVLAECWPHHLSCMELFFAARLQATCWEADHRVLVVSAGDAVL